MGSTLESISSLQVTADVLPTPTIPLKLLNEKQMLCLLPEVCPFNLFLVKLVLHDSQPTFLALLSLAVCSFLKYGTVLLAEFA